MGGRFRHAQHVIRVVMLFGFGFLAFLVVRWALIPSDFGLHGFYRAGALGEIAAKPAVYGGKPKCVECHETTVDTKSKHLPLSCETCHGPNAAHAAGPFDVKPATIDVRPLCLRCHTRLAGRPEKFPQIDADHGGDVKCTECHKPHHPQLID